MKAKGLTYNYHDEEKSNPYIERVYAAILEDDDSTTDEMLIQKAETAEAVEAAGRSMDERSAKLRRAAATAGLETLL